MKRARSKNAATAIVWFALALVGLQLAFHFPLAQAFPQIHDIHFGKKLNRLRTIAALAREHRRPLVLATGSSLTEFGVCPTVMPGHYDPQQPLCFNFGMVSQGPVAQLVNLKRILADGIRPDMVLAEIAPFLLYMPQNIVQNGEYLPPVQIERGDFETLERYHPAPNALADHWRTFQFAPWWSYRRNLHLWAYPDELPRAMSRHQIHTDDWGWLIPPAGFQNWVGYDRDGGGERLHRHYSTIYALPPDPRFQAAYLELAETCRKYNIRCVMVAPPECSYIRTSYAHNRSHHFGQLLDRLQNEAGAILVDARDWVPDHEFWDGTHLLPQGTIRYSWRLDLEVIRRHCPPATLQPH